MNLKPDILNWYELARYAASRRAAFEFGKKCANDGVQVEECPFTDRDQAEAWVEGWDYYNVHGWLQDSQAERINRVLTEKKAAMQSDPAYAAGFRDGLEMGKARVWPN